MAKTQTSFGGLAAGMTAPLPGERAIIVPSVERRRSDWVDASKGVGIFLVVVGHTLRGLVNAELMPSDGVAAFVDRFIYAFHMPLFFFLSGLFLLPKADESFGLFARRRLVRLGYPYLVWATLQLLLQIALSRHTNNPARIDDLWTISVAPPMQFWFLYALLLQALFLGALARLGLGRTGLLGLSALLFVAAPYLPMGGWLPLYQARDALVYTALGVWIGESGRMATVSRARTSLLAAGIVLGYAGVILYVAAGLSQHHLALVPALLGMVASVSLCCLLARSAGIVGEHLRELGQASLAIFVAHTLASAAVRIALHKLLHLDHLLLHVLAGVAAGLYVPFVLQRLSRRAPRLQYLFQWPERRSEARAALS